MQIIVLGAGHVGRAIVEALHAEHEITVIDVDSRRLGSLSDHYDCRIVDGDGTTKQVVRKAGVEGTDLFLGCSPREEANLVCAMLVKRMSDAKAIIRSSSTAYLDAWRERHLEVDFMVSPELETAYAVSGSLGIPAARHTDVFADGQVQVVEFDVPDHAERNEVIGRSLRQAEIPADSKVAGLIRGEKMVVPRGDERIRAGDRVVVIGSPAAARAWSKVVSGRERSVDDVVVFGAGRMGTTIASACSSAACASASSTPSASAWPRSPRRCRRCARSTPTCSTPSSSSASGSAAPGRACTASTTTRRTSTARCWRRSTACD